MSRVSATDQRPRSLIGAVFVWLLLIGAAHAAPPDALPETARGFVSAVLTGDSLRIVGVAEDIRLAGIQAPQRRGGYPSPFAETAKEALLKLAQEHELSVRSVPAGADRDGRLRAHVVRADGLWVQHELVRRGVVRVLPTADTAVFVAELLAAEREARAANRVLWATSAYGLRRATDVARLRDDIGTFQVVAGTIVTTARRGDDIFLNFGEDFRTDFTATIPRPAWPLFKELDPVALAGRRVQVRGWIVSRNGPSLELTHPAALEVLPEDAGSQPIR